MALKYFDLGLAAEASASDVVKAGASSFATEQAKVAAFTATGNPEADWTIFNQMHRQAVQRYSQLAARDNQAAGKTTARIPAGLPPQLAAALAGKASVATASSPAPAAAAPVNSASPAAATAAT